MVGDVAGDGREGRETRVSSRVGRRRRGGVRRDSPTGDVDSPDRVRHGEPLVNGNGVRDSVS